MKKIWTVLKNAFKEFQRDKVTRLAAALSYYMAISIAPMIVFVLLILGFVLGQETAQNQVISQLQGVMGDQGIAFIETIINNANQPTAGSIAGILSLATLIWGSTNVFAHLQETLNSVWNVKPKPQGLIKTVRRRLSSFLMVLGVGLVFLLSLVAGAVLSVVSNTITGVLPGGAIIWQIVEFLISLAIATLLFAVIYKFVPDAETKWSDIWPGAFITALLFTLGKIALSIYLGRAAPGSTYGAAGSVIVFLLWVYYSSIILFFGAEMTQVYANRFGAGIEPDEDAIFVDRPITAD